MENRIGHFLFEENNEEIQLNYFLTKKDWYDFSIKMSISFFPLLFGFIMVIDNLDRERIRFWWLFVGLIFIFCGLIFFSDAILVINNIKKGKKPIIRFLKEENILLFRKSILRLNKYEINDVEQFQVINKDESKFFRIIEMKLKNGTAERISIVNLKNTSQHSNEASEKQMEEAARNLVKELNKRIKDLEK